MWRCSASSAGCSGRALRNRRFRRVLRLLRLLLGALAIFALANAHDRRAEIVLAHALRMLEDVVADERRLTLIQHALPVDAGAIERQRREDRRRNLEAAAVDVLAIEPVLLAVFLDGPVAPVASSRRVGGDDRLAIGLVDGAHRAVGALVVRLRETEPSRLQLETRV